MSDKKSKLCAKITHDFEQLEGMDRIAAKSQLAQRMRDFMFILSGIEGQVGSTDFSMDELKDCIANLWDDTAQDNMMGTEWHAQAAGYLVLSELIEDGNGNIDNSLIATLLAIANGLIDMGYDHRTVANYFEAIAQRVHRLEWETRASR